MDNMRWTEYKRTRKATQKQEENIHKIRRQCLTNGSETNYDKKKKYIICIK